MSNMAGDSDVNREFDQSLPRGERWTGSPASRVDGTYPIDQLGAGYASVTVRDGMVVSETWTGPGLGGEILTWSVIAAREQRRLRGLS
jgi:hypothetical protein